MTNRKEEEVKDAVMSLKERGAAAVSAASVLKVFF